MKILEGSKIVSEDDVVHIFLNIGNDEWLRISVDSIGVLDFLNDKCPDDGSYEQKVFETGISINELYSLLKPHSD